MYFGLEFIALHGAIADIHEVFELEPFPGEEIFGFVLASVRNVELILKIKIV
jgi:hypothetical protein